MNERNDKNMPSDELLVAFIDGELDGTESARIEALIGSDTAVAERFDRLAQASALPFAEAFEPLLEKAPSEQLQQMLAALPSPAVQPGRRAGIGRRGFLAAAAACVVAGIAVDRTAMLVGRRLSRPSEGEEWRAVVAEYLSLYDADTLSAPPGDRNAQAAELAVVAERLDLRLTPDRIGMPGVSFRRAQVLVYDGKPLAQIVYLDPETGPMALCIIASAGGAAEPDMERRHGMNVVYWSDAGHAFMLIGHDSIDRMKDLADGLRGQLSA